MQPNLTQAIQRHAEAAVPNECVGALLGTEGEVRDTLPLDNASSTPRVAFELSAASYLHAERTAAARGLEVVGFYHSHVDAPATPSARDLEHAAHFARLIIVSVRDGVAGLPQEWPTRRSTALAGE